MVRVSESKYELSNVLLVRILYWYFIYLKNVIKDNIILAVEK